MALKEVEQIQHAIQNCQRILIAFPKEFTADALAAALALSLILRKMGKPADIVCDQFSLPNNLQFLSGSERVKTALHNIQKFIISVNVNSAPLEELSYSVENGTLNILLAPQSGHYTTEDVATKQSEFAYDLIFVVGSPDLEALGATYKNLPDFFYATTIINIDHKAANDQFGQINITNPNAVACCELTYQLIQSLDEKLFDKDVATCLLAGLIAETKSFKTVTVTPAALEIAGNLLELGANQDGIIKALYRSRSLGTLNLWGRVLARLRSDNGNRLVWSLITENDFIESGATPEELPEVVDELISFIPGVEVVIIFYQQPGNVGVLVHAIKGQNALFLAKAFRPTGSKTVARFAVPEQSLSGAEKVVVAGIKEQLGRSS